jgi:hypothetical protein
MRASLRRLLDGAIDYAGLFPPARLDMAAAVREYLDLRQGPDAWIVSRFACATGRLEELRRELDAARPDAPVPVTAIGRGGDDLGGWENGLEADAADLNRFLEGAGGLATIEAFEARVPAEENVSRYLADLKGFEEADVFVELPWLPAPDDRLEAVAETEWLGVKARTGGVEASAFPDSERLAAFLHGCVSLELPFKLTAGLHHPLPHRDVGMGARMHGFVNVFAATALALGCDLNKREVATILGDESPESWRFDDGALAWQGREASLAHIEAARALLAAFGSCSVREPLEGLEKLGWLETTRGQAS